MQHQLEVEPCWSVGQAVWAKFNNLHPWWPGIIADESARAQNPQEKQPRTVLVNFFGDNSWGWVKDKDLLPFF